MKLHSGEVRMKWQRKTSKKSATFRGGITILNCHFAHLSFRYTRRATVPKRYSGRSATREVTGAILNVPMLPTVDSRG
jgi:hypothetical protein